MFGLSPLGTYLVSSLLQNVMPSLINSLVAQQRPQLIQITGDIMSSDVRETPDSYILRAILPGVTRESLNVQYADNYLILTANSDEYLRDKYGNYVRYIRRIDKRFYFSDVDVEKIDGSFENGVLQLILPKLQKQ